MTICQHTINLTAYQEYFAAVIGIEIIVGLLGFAASMTYLVSLVAVLCITIQIEIVHSHHICHRYYYILGRATMVMKFLLGLYIAVEDNKNYYSMAFLMYPLYPFLLPQTWIKFWEETNTVDICHCEINHS